MPLLRQNFVKANTVKFKQEYVVFYRCSGDILHVKIFFNHKYFETT